MQGGPAAAWARLLPQRAPGPAGQGRLHAGAQSGASKHEQLQAGGRWRRRPTPRNVHVHG